ncbi:uncharacterized protein LOC127714681 [Mytilus californianus]|uniref:uncharacterized protein LOC127714681 n=1 Tax=Mytilus californianus TaxID=6549 RepID=UPI002246BBDC|nr:uncharacterized protein LOC127714681 [Mytilus californianus]
MTSQAITRSTACPFAAGTQDEKEQEDLNWKGKACIAVLSLIITSFFIICMLKCGTKYRTFSKNVRNLQDIKDQTERVQDEIQYTKEAGTVKRCIKVNIKDIINTIKCEPIVGHLLSKRILTDQDKEQIFLCLGPQKKNKKLLEIVWQSGIEACKAFLAELNSDPSYRHLVNQIKKTKGGIDDYIEELDIEFDGLRNVKVPKEISDLHEKYLLAWQKDDRKFIITTVVQQVKNKLLDDHCVLLVGGPGTGKSSIMRHLALYLCNEFGFDVVPVESGQSNILEFYNSSRRQVFVVDDMCGKEHINIQFVEIWKIKINQILKLIEKDTHSIKDSGNNRVKFLFSSRLIICQDRIFQHLDIPDQYKCDISQWKLTNDERQQMLQMYHAENIKIESGLHKECPVEDFEFRLLVKLSEGKTAAEMRQLFQSPLNFINTDLIRIKESNIFWYCGIALCVLFDNELKPEWLGEESSPFNIKLALAEFYSEISLDLKTDYISKRIKEELEQLEMTRLHVYITKLGNVYHIENVRIFDIAAKLCGQMSLRTFINHASSEFISERYTFDRSYQLQKIVVEKAENKKWYFDRILKDLENGITYSTFHNSQLANNIYRIELCKYFDQRHSKITEVFLNLNRIEKESVHGVDNITNLNPSNKRSSFIQLGSRMYSYTQRSSVPIIESVWLGHSELVRQVIKMNCNVNEIDRFERSAILVASFLGYMEIVKLLFENGAKMSVCDNQGRSPMFAACEEGHNNVVEYLFEKGANILICNHYERSPLFIACATGHKSIVEFLLRKNKQNISKPDILHETPLFIASARGRKDIVEILLENGADKRQVDQRGCSPLFIAATNGHYKVVKLLLERKCDITQTDHDGRSVLYIASQEGYNKIIKLFIEYDKSLISKCNWCGKSSLFVACEQGHLEVVETLIESSADVNQCDENRKSPLYVSCEKGNLDIVKKLLENNAHIKNFDRDGRSPFYIASRGGFVEIMEELLLKGANPLHCNKWDGSVLNITCREGHVDAVKLLLLNNADVSKADSIGNTPIYIASEEGYASVVDILLKNNADINISNKEGKTPLHAACTRGQENVVELLFRKKAKRNPKDANGETPYDKAKQRGYSNILAIFERIQEGK